MMPGESPNEAFGERRGIGADIARERNALLLTDRRVIRISRTRRVVTTTFHSLEDVHSAEVHHRPRGIRRLFRMALLLAGAGAALVAVDSALAARVLAGVLGLGALHHLYQFISVSREGSIHFRTTQQELTIPYRGPSAEQAYSLVNRFFHLKSLLSAAAQEGSEGVDERAPRERHGKPFSRWQQRGRDIWYELWFLDRSVPVSQILPMPGAKSGNTGQESVEVRPGVGDEAPRIPGESEAEGDDRRQSETSREA